MGKELSTRKHPNGRVSGTRCWRQHHRCKTCPDGHVLHVWLDGEGTNTKSTPKWAHFWCSAPCRIEEHQTDMTGRGDPPRRVKESQTDTTGRVSPLVTSNRTHRRNGEGLSSSLRPMNSNRHDREGEPSPSRSVE